MKIEFVRILETMRRETWGQKTELQVMLKDMMKQEEEYKPLRGHTKNSEK